MVLYTDTSRCSLCPDSVNRSETGKWTLNSDPDKRSLHPGPLAEMASESEIRLDLDPDLVKVNLDLDPNKFTNHPDPDKLPPNPHLSMADCSLLVFAGATNFLVLSHKWRNTEQWRDR